MKHITESWNKGLLESVVITDDADSDEVILRDSILTAVTALQTIQDTQFDNFAKANIALHVLAELNEKLLKYLNNRIRV